MHARVYILVVKYPQLHHIRKVNRVDFDKPCDLLGKGQHITYIRNMINSYDPICIPLRNP